MRSFEQVGYTWTIPKARIRANTTARGISTSETDVFGVPSACQRELLLGHPPHAPSKPAYRWPYSDAASQSPKWKAISTVFAFCRLHFLWLKLAFALLQGCSAQATLRLPIAPTEQAAPAESLINTSGVCTHLTYTDSLYYTQWPAVFNSLQQLGIKHIRDGYHESPARVTEFSQNISNWPRPASRRTYVVPFDTSITVQTLQQFASRGG